MVDYNLNDLPGAILRFHDRHGAFKRLSAYEEALRGKPYCGKNCTD
jgi:hypothetical protein